MVNRCADYSGKGEVYRKYRSGYSDTVLDLLIAHTNFDSQTTTVADIGAGTGIWTRQLLDRKFRTIAIEPNDDMRENGVLYTQRYLDVQWKKGFAEESGLADSSVDWVTMASSFHWADPDRALNEFNRVLRKGGFITLLWNPIVKKGDDIQERIERIIHDSLPEFSREFRTGENTPDIISSSIYFRDLVEIRHTHYITQSVEHYMGAWRAANHLRLTAESRGEGYFEELLRKIRESIGNVDNISVPYQTRSWTAQKR